MPSSGKRSMRKKTRGDSAANKQRELKRLQLFAWDSRLANQPLGAPPVSSGRGSLQLSHDLRGTGPGRGFIR